MTYNFQPGFGELLARLRYDLRRLLSFYRSVTILIVRLHHSPYQRRSDQACTHVKIL